MPGFLISEENPDGYKHEDILIAIRKDVIQRATKIMDDRRPKAHAVLTGNIRILGLLSESIEIAENSTALLDNSFGRHEPNTPRIGKV